MHESIHTYIVHTYIHTYIHMFKQMYKNLFMYSMYTYIHRVWMQFFRPGITNSSAERIALRRRNSTGTIYIATTMSSQDNKSTIGTFFSIHTYIHIYTYILLSLVQYLPYTHIHQIILPQDNRFLLKHTYIHTYIHTCCFHSYNTSHTHTYSTYIKLYFQL